MGMVAFSFLFLELNPYSIPVHTLVPVYGWDLLELLSLGGYNPLLYSYIMNYG